MPRGPRPQYGQQHQQDSARLRTEHVAAKGWVCPGMEDYDVPMHPSRDLVADHNVPGDPSQGYTVRCRSCNTRRMNAA